MRLPNGNRSVIELDKLIDYCLNLDHPRGRHKARVFAAALNIQQSDAQILRDALMHAAVAVDADMTSADEFGERYVVEFDMAGPGGPVTVRSLWIIRTGEDFPRLTSCYVK